MSPRSTDVLTPTAERTLHVNAEHRFRAMATRVSVRLWRPGGDPRELFRRVERIFTDVELECTRFDPTSDLMRANASADVWTQVGAYCASALQEAAAAHVRTGGDFDPRVLGVLTELGYDRTLPFASESVQRHRHLPGAGIPAEAWQPGFDPGGRVRVGPVPVDLGGIGKGLAVRWAAQALQGSAAAFLIEAGGDCYLGGAGPSGHGWYVGVEDPDGGADPVAVLAVQDAACATTSTRVRRWTVDGTDVHHIIDPRRGAPADSGLRAVTVVGPDPATAEVWSKVAFIRGAGRTGELAADDLSAFWVHADGSLGWTPAMASLLRWSRT